MLLSFTRAVAPCRSTAALLPSSGAASHQPPAPTRPLTSSRALLSLCFVGPRRPCGKPRQLRATCHLRVHRAAWSQLPDRHRGAQTSRCRPPVILTLQRWGGTGAETHQQGEEEGGGEACIGCATPACHLAALSPLLVLLSGSSLVSLSGRLRASPSPLPLSSALSTFEPIRKFYLSYFLVT